MRATAWADDALESLAQQLTDIRPDPELSERVLVSAASGGSVRTLEWLRSCCAPPELWATTRGACLCAAAERGRVGILKYLLDMDMDMEGAGEDGHLINAQDE